MPNGIFPVPQFRSYPARTSKHPGFVLRMRTRWRRNRLDEELSHGADPATSADLTLRAMQLRSPATRLRLANTLAEISRDARRLEAFTVDFEPQRVAIRDCSEGLLALVSRLRDERPVDVRGVAMTAWLLNDAASPLHRNGERTLCHAVQSARIALDETARDGQDLATAA
jgi:hypothetical protein